MRYILTILLAAALALLARSQTKGFTLSKISPVVSLGQSSPFTPEIAHILDQPFHFLAAGGSCYAFESADHQYVLKFFKFHHLRPTKLQRVFSSIQYAYTQFRAETGLVYLHLQPTADHHPITIIDPTHIAHTLDLAATSCFIQRKAELAYPYISKLEPEKAQAACQQIIDLIQLIHARGFDDVDPNIETNFGFIDGQAVKIDVGPFIPATAETQFPNSKHIKALQKFSAWMKAHDI